MSAVKGFLALLVMLGGVRGVAEEVDTSRPSITGSVTGVDGTPLAGVRVDISTAAPKVGRGIFCPSCYLDCGKWATTDDDGQFTIASLDPTLKFHLVLTHPEYQTLQTPLIDPAGEAVSLSLDPLSEDIDPSRVVLGVVTQNGTPVAGALVDPHGAKTVDRRWWGRVDGVTPTVTDAQGRFAMVLPDDYLGLDIRVEGHGFCGEQRELLKPGAEPQSIEVRTGATVTGRLMHHGQPVAGMSIAVVQLNRSTADDIFIAAVGDVTDSEGRFEIRYLPPDQRYCIYSVAGEAKRSESPFILTTKTFTMPGTDESRDLGDLEVSQPCSIRGRVVRSDGKPLPPNLRLSFGRDPAWDLVSALVEDDGSFEVTGLPPETYEVRVGDRDMVMASDQILFQMLSDVSFGIRLRQSIDDLVVPIQAKE